MPNDHVPDEPLPFRTPLRVEWEGKQTVLNTVDEAIEWLISDRFLRDQTLFRSMLKLGSARVVRTREAVTEAVRDLEHDLLLIGATRREWLSGYSRPEQWARYQGWRRHLKPRT